MTTAGHVRKRVNETIISALKAGKVLGRSDYGFPRDILNRRRFGGIESILLMLDGFRSPYWGTLPEWELLGGKVKHCPGSQTLNNATLFNLDQISGDFPVSRHERRTVDYAWVEKVIAKTGADIRFTHDRIAEYHVKEDFILMCHKEHFVRGQGGIGAYYHTLFHELAHWSEGPLDWYAEVDKRGKLQVDELEFRAEIVADFLTTELYVPSQPYFTRCNIHKHLDIWIGKMRPAANPGLYHSPPPRPPPPPSPVAPPSLVAATSLVALAPWGGGPCGVGRRGRQRCLRPRR
jgi:antirestriction protein ArdC